jgi:hypothetical protein
MELMRLSEVQNMRSDLMEILDRMIEVSAQASVIRWFRENDREATKSELLRDGAIDTESILDWAKEKIRSQGKEGEGEKFVPPPSLNPGQAHRTAAATYQKRNIAAGKCMSCPEPLDPSSVRYCTKHLAMQRARMQTKNAKPGTADYLYAGEQTDPGPGRSPDQLTRLAINREQKTRAVLAELGISPESAAVTLDAAKEALLKVMPTSRGQAKTQAQLFELATIPTSTTGKKAINELLAAGEVERIGKGGQNHEYRYFVRKRSSNWKGRQNQTIAAILKGEVE